MQRVKSGKPITSRRERRSRLTGPECPGAEALGIEVRTGEKIGAKELEVPARGDSIRVWYSANTEVIGNRVDQGRDVVLWYNNGAVIRDNVITNGRYGLHFMYCDDNLVEDNWIEGNSVGAFLMYSRRLTLRRNVFASNRGPSGYGIETGIVFGV